MALPRFVARMIAVGMMVPVAGLASGQGFPNKPIRIVTYTPASAGDFVGRLIGPGLSGSLGQPVIVDNRVALIAEEVVARASPDGYTLLIAGTTFWIGGLLRKMPYDAVRDFAPITLATTSPVVLVVHPTSAVKSVKELIALAKARPGEINYGSGAAGSSNHLAAELFKAMAGVSIVWINYKGVGAAVSALIGGEVQLMFVTGATVMPHVKSGRLLALAISSAQPSVLFPGLPTIAAAGLPGYESIQMSGVFAPAKTPAAAINRLNQEIVRVLNMADVKEKFLSSGVEAAGSSPGQFAATIKSEIAKMGKVIRDAGTREE